MHKESSVSPKRLRTLHERFAVELGSQVCDHLFVDQRIDVLAQLIQDEPVADLAFVSDVLDVFVRRQSAACAQQVQTNLRPQADGEAVDERDARQNRQCDEPEPQEHENLLVDDVERKNAK